MSVCLSVYVYMHAYVQYRFNAMLHSCTQVYTSVSAKCEYECNSSQISSSLLSSVTACKNHSISNVKTSI